MIEWIGSALYLHARLWQVPAIAVTWYMLRWVERRIGELNDAPCSPEEVADRHDVTRACLRAMRHREMMLLGYVIFALAPWRAAGAPREYDWIVGLAAVPLVAAWWLVPGMVWAGSDRWRRWLVVGVIGAVSATALGALAYGAYRAAMVLYAIPPIA